MTDRVGEAPPILLFAYANERCDERYLRNLPEERRGLEDVLRAAHDAGRCEVAHYPNATIDEVVAACQRGQDRIAVFHFAGHADGQTLLFETATGTREVADGTTLAAFLSTLPGLALVVLNGCATEPQVAALLAAGVPAVIATTVEIRDDAAAEFSVRLYRALGHGATIARAFAQASHAIQLGRTGGATRALYRDVAVAPGAKHDELPWRLHGTEAAHQRRVIAVPRRVRPLVGVVAALAALVGVVGWFARGHADPQPGAPPFALIVPAEDARMMINPERASPFEVQIGREVVPLNEHGVLIGTVAAVPEGAGSAEGLSVPDAQTVRRWIALDAEVARSIKIRYLGHPCKDPELARSEHTLWLVQLTDCPH